MKKLLMAAAIVTALGAGVSDATAGYSQYIFHENGTMTEYVINDENLIVEIWNYDEDGHIVSGGFYDSDPNPEGDSGATGSPSELKEALEQFLKNGGGDMTLETDPFETVFGKALVETGKTGAIVPYHNPADSLAYDFEGGGAGKGGIDLNGGSITEQITQNAGKKKNNDDDDGDDDGGSGDPGTDDDELEFGGASADMELVNPVPVLQPQSDSAGPEILRRLRAAFGNPDGTWRSRLMRSRVQAPRPAVTQALRSAPTARTIR